MKETDQIVNTDYINWVMGWYYLTYYSMWCDLLQRACIIVERKKKINKECYMLCFSVKTVLWTCIHATKYFSKLKKKKKWHGDPWLSTTRQQKGTSCPSHCQRRPSRKSAFSPLPSGNEATTSQLWGQRRTHGSHPSPPRNNKETSFSGVNRRKPGLVPGSTEVPPPPLPWQNNVTGNQIKGLNRIQNLRT